MSASRILLSVIVVCCQANQHFEDRASEGEGSSRFHSWLPIQLQTISTIRESLFWSQILRVRLRVFHGTADALCEDTQQDLAKRIRWQWNLRLNWPPLIEARFRYFGFPCVRTQSSMGKSLDSGEERGTDLSHVSRRREKQCGFCEVFVIHHS